MFADLYLDYQVSLVLILPSVKLTKYLAFEHKTIHVTFLVKRSRDLSIFAMAQKPAYKTVITHQQSSTILLTRRANFRRLSAQDGILNTASEVRKVGCKGIGHPDYHCSVCHQRLRYLCEVSSLLREVTDHRRLSIFYVYITLHPQALNSTNGLTLLFDGNSKNMTRWRTSRYTQAVRSGVYCTRV
jgi:hypothetical protein